MIQTRPTNEPDQSGIADSRVSHIFALSQLKPDAILTLEDLARELGKCTESVKRAVKRGELPPSTKLMGKPIWSVGSILRQIELSLDMERQSWEKERQRFSKHQL